MRRRDRGAEPAGDDGRDVRGEILAATERLLAARRFDELAVADILGEAGVSRGSFYFYFAGKAEVLAALVRGAVGVGHEAAEPWLHHDEGPEPDVRAAVRSGIADGARLWRDRAPVLRAIVENWRTDLGLAALWQEQMGGYTAVTLARLQQDAATGGGPPAGVDPAALAAALTWLGERLYYLAAIGVPPFDDEDVLVDTLTGIWMSTLYPSRVED